MDPNKQSQPELPHAPGEVINPSAQPEPQIVHSAQPEQQPASMQTAQQPPVPSAPNSQTGITQLGITQPFNLREIPDEKNRKKIFKKLSIPVLALILVIIGSLIAINQGILMPNRLKTVQYTNDKGNKYSLKFYAANKVEKLSNLYKGTSASNMSSNATGLFAKHGKDGKYPLGVVLWTYKTVPALNENAFGNCSGSKEVATAYNNYAQKDVKICGGFSTDSEDAMYISLIKGDKKAVLAMFVQEWNATSIKDKESAKKFLNSQGLSSYDNDIKQIVASIKPLD